MLTAHKIELTPNNVQAGYLARACGTARFAYNWALAEWKAQYTAGGKPNEAALRKQLNAIKRKHFPWMLEVTKCAPQLAIKALGVPFKNFFNHTARYPKFHKKGIHESFSVSNDHFSVHGKKLRIPKLTPIRMTEAFRFEGKLLSATISRTADRWFVSIVCEVSDLPQTADASCAIGVDLGVKNLTTFSDGTKNPALKPYKKQMDRLRRLSRSLTRKQKGSKNRAKAKVKLARFHARIRSVRKDALHKLTTKLVRNYGIIGIEDLNVKGMTKNHLLRSRPAKVERPLPLQCLGQRSRQGGLLTPTNCLDASVEDKLHNAHDQRNPHLPNSRR